MEAEPKGWDRLRRLRRLGWISGGIWVLAGFAILGFVYGMMVSLALADPPVFILVSQ